MLRKIDVAFNVFGSDKMHFRPEAGCVHDHIPGDEARLQNLALRYGKGGDETLCRVHALTVRPIMCWADGYGRLIR